MGEYVVENLTVLDEATTRCLEIGGVKLRLLGLGGALVMAKMFDNGVSCHESTGFSHLSATAEFITDKFSWSPISQFLSLYRKAKLP